MLQLDNGATLDFIEDTGYVTAQHYAFLVGEDDFDAIWDRLKTGGRQFWPTPTSASGQRPLSGWRPKLG